MTTPADVKQVIEEQIRCAVVGTGEELVIYLSDRHMDWYTSLPAVSRKYVSRHVRQFAREHGHHLEPTFKREPNTAQPELVHVTIDVWVSASIQDPEDHVREHLSLGEGILLGDITREEE